MWIDLPVPVPVIRPLATTAVSVPPAAVQVAPSSPARAVSRVPSAAVNESVAIVCSTASPSRQWLRTPVVAATAAA